MLCINNYTQEYIDECRAGISAQIASYQTLVSAVKIKASITAFESLFFNNMVLAMDSYFVHRARIAEMKDGNPLNEVRMLCNSLMNNHGKLCADITIKYEPAKSILKLAIGDKIKLNEVDFQRLSLAYFRELERKYL